MAIGKVIADIIGYTKTQKQLKNHWVKDLGMNKNALKPSGQYAGLLKAATIAKMALDMVAGGLDRYKKFQKIKFDMAFAKNAALAKVEVDKLNVAVQSWTNTMTGASNALKTYTSNVQELAKVQMANEMKWEEYKTNVTSELVKQFPIVGDVVAGLWKSVMSYRDQLLKQEQEEINKRIELAKQYYDKAIEISDAIDKYLNIVDKEIVTYGRRNAMSVKQTEVIRRAELAHASYYATLNATVDDAMKIASGYREGTGRAVNMSLNAMMSTIAAGKVVGEEIVARTQNELYLFNKSAGDVANMMVKTQNSVGKMGLSTQKVMKAIADNMKLAQEFQFRNGTAGLREMTVMAENLRFNMSSLSTMLNKIQENGLEGVVKQSAALQVLGGNIGMGADPFALAYNAFQDPKQMMENVSKMLKGFGTFDQRTGETKFAINEQIRLAEFAKTMGMSKSDVMNMIRESNKKEIVKGLVTDNRLNDEQLNAISNLATRNENGDWEVQTIDGQKKNVNEVRMEDLDNLLANNKDDQALQYAKSQLTVTEKIESITKSINAMLGGDLWDAYDEKVQKVNQQTLRAYDENKQGIVNGVKDTYREQAEKQNSMLMTLRDFYEEYQKSQQEMKLGDILSKDEDEITDEDKAYAKDLIQDKIQTFIKRNNLDPSQVFNDDGTIRHDMYDSEYVRKITNGKEKFTPINESQLQKLGMEHGFWEKTGNIGATALASTAYSTGRLIYNAFSDENHIDDGMFQLFGNRENFRDIEVNDMVYSPRSGVRPILTAGDVRAHLSEDDVVIAMKNNGPIANSGGNMGSGKMELTINGTIRLDSDGGSIDLSELSKNPIFIRNIERMIAESRFTRANGTHNY